MATVQNNKIEFVIGDKAKISAADAYKLWFDTTHKQIILKGVEFIPKKLSELTNDSGFITSITKAMVEGVLTGTISSHTHAFSSLTSKPTTLSGYGITDGVTTSTLNSSLSKYLPLKGGTLTGSLTVNNASIVVNGGNIVGDMYIKAPINGATGFVGCFNQSQYALKGVGTHLFGNNSKGQGNNAIALGVNSWAGVRNQDSDKDTYPYLAWQWMNTQPIEVNTTTSSVGGGTFYGYPLLGGEVVEYSTPDGGLFTYENTTQKLQFLLLVKNYDKFVFAGSATSSEPRNVVCYMFGGMYVLRNVINKVTERVIGDTTYYEVVVNQNSSTALDYTKYNPSNQMQLLCATKCNADNFSGANSYISGRSSIAMNYECKAFGNQSIALGMHSIVTSFCSNAIGYNSVAANSYSIAFGGSSFALGQSSLTFGNSSVANSYASAAFGEESVTLGDYSMTFGRRSVANGVGSMNFALYGISNHTYQTVFGKYNKPEDAALIVGGGTGTADAGRKNIFKVDWRGNVTGKSFSGYSNSVGGEGFKIYPENSNEINFGGTGSSPIIVFGASSKDSRAVPTTYKFGAGGDAVLMGGVFTGVSKSANMLDTARKLTIGNTGKTFDGTADVSWSLDEIGVKDENVKFTTSADNVDYRLTAIGQRIAGNVEGTNSVVTADGITMNPSTGAVKAKSFEASKYLQGLVKNSAESKVADVTGQNVFSTNGGGTGTYSNVFGVNSYAGYNNGRTYKPYTYMNIYNTEQITVNGNSCYAYEVSPSETVNFTYNGIGYSYSNDSSTLTRVMCVVKGSDIVANHSYNGLKRVGFIFNNYKQTLKTSNITWTELIDDVDAAYLIVVNQFNSTKQNYDFSTVCNIFLATAGTNSNFKGDRANVFGFESLCGSSGIIFGANNTILSGAVFGAYNNILGVESYVFGQSNHTSPYSSYNTIFGNDCYCGGTYSNLLGVGLINTTVQYQTIIGKYNLPTNDAFMIGWGSSATDRKNIFTIDKRGNVTGKSFSGYSNSVGGEGFKIYPENSNQINFGGTGSSPIIVFGASSKDSRAVPTTYKFGANGDASLIGSSFSGNSATATKLSTPRTLTIGNTGKTFDGSGNISWTLEEIGAKDENVKFTTSADNVDYRLTAIGQRIAGNVEGTNSVVTADGITMNPSTGNLKATSFTGSLIGNAATATKLKTPQNLWGNSFDGSGSVSADLKFVADGLTSQVSHGMRIGSDYGGFIGFSQILGKDGVGVFTGISLGWGANPETDAASVRINATKFTYKSYPILHSNNFSDYAPTKTGGGASGTWGISISGNADTATALTSSAGSSTQPIYFSNGKPVACFYTLAKSVPSNAVFTDTTYSVATDSADGLMSSEMYNTEKVSSISVRQGAAVSEEIVRNHDIYVTYNKDKVLNSDTHVIGGDVQLKIPNATTDYDGSMSYLDKRKLTNIQDGCIAASVYVMTINYDTLNDLNGIESPIMDFANLNNIMTSGKFPDMIRLVLNNSIHVFTLYESYLSDKYAQYRCEGRKAEISILVNNYVSFSVN